MDPATTTRQPDHRTVCIRLREVCIQQVRLIRDLMQHAQPERLAFYRELTQSMTHTVRLIEAEAGLRSWDGA